MKGYKVFHERKDGTIGPLFMNRKQVIQIGEWLKAESHPTKGYALRPGWHACLRKFAPHLKIEDCQKEKRVWCEVELEDCEFYDRPESQGGQWVLAQRLKVIRKMES